MTSRAKSFFQKLVNNGDLKFNRKLGIYIVCLLLATLLWLLITLSEKYETDIVFPVTYTGISKNKVVTNKLPETITARVYAGGFGLLWFKIKGIDEPLTFEIQSSKLRELNGNYYTLTNNRLEKISAQLGDKIKVLHISPDTIYVSFAEKMKRKLRVKPALNMTLKKMHGFSDSIKAEPEYVNISGPRNILEKMTFAETQEITLHEVSDRQQLNVGLKKPGNTEGIIFSPETVKLIIPVEKYTEGSQEIQLTIRNQPKGSKLKVIPEKVKITYLVGMSKYDKVEPAMFAAGFDYKKLKRKGNKIKVELFNTPSFVQSVKIEPASVEYIIQK